MTRPERTPAVWAAAIAAIACALLVICAAPARAGTVLVLKSRAMAAYDSAEAGFRSAFAGPTTTLTVEDAEPNALARDIGRLRPDAVVTIGLRAAMYARDHLPRTPLVFCAVQQPERHDLSGAWITGISTDVSPATELAALRFAAPRVQRVAVFFGVATGQAFIRSARIAAREAHLTLIELPVSAIGEVAPSARRAQSTADAYWMPADATVATAEVFRFLLEVTLKGRRPLLVFSDALVRSGALVAVSPDYSEAGVQAAESVRRIQAGERAGDIPVSAVRRTRVVLNESTARALGIVLPTTFGRVAEVVR